MPLDEVRFTPTVVIAVIQAAQQPTGVRNLDRFEPFAVYLPCAEVAELADARDSKSRSFGSVGSTPTFGIRRL